MTTIQIFHKMFDHLVSNKLIPNQTELARAAGLNEVSVSRILNGQVKSVKQETLWKVNNAFDNIFNPEWMRGKSDVMLMDDLAQVSTVTPVQQTVDPTTALLAAKDEAIASLKRELAAKDDVIAAKDVIISTKDKLIDTLQQQIDALRIQIAIEKGLHSTGTSRSVAADNQSAATYEGK